MGHVQELDQRRLVQRVTILTGEQVSQNIVTQVEEERSVRVESAVVEH